MACLLEPMLNLGGEFLPVLRLARILRVLKLVTAIQVTTLGRLPSQKPAIHVLCKYITLFFMFTERWVFFCTQEMTRFISGTYRLLYYPYFA